MLDEDKTLIGDDKNSTIGTELFARRSMPRYEKTTVTVKAEDGTTSDIEVYKYNEEDPEDTYSLYTIGQLVMNPTVLQDSSTILPSIQRPVENMADMPTRNWQGLRIPSMKN